jgi:hypothetical protein
VRELKSLQPPLFLFFFLISFCLHAQLVYGSGLVLHVTSDKPIYPFLDQVYIQANLTENGIPVSDGLIAFEMADPIGRWVVTRTLQTETPPVGLVNITQAFLCNQTGHPVDFVVEGVTEAYFYVSIKNIGSYTLSNVFATVNFYQDLYFFPFHAHLAVNFPSIEVNGTRSFYQSFHIPWEWVSAGTVVAYVNVFSGLPRDGGYPYCTEKASAFEIVEWPNPPSGTDFTPPNHNYNLTFKIPPDAEVGNYRVYARGGRYPTYATAPFYQITVELPGDVNGDNKVNYIDLFALADAYGSEPGDGNWDERCDFNDDDKVNYEDLFTLGDYYGLPK